VRPARALEPVAIGPRVKPFAGGADTKNDHSECLHLVLTVVTVSRGLCSSEGMSNRFEMFACHAPLLIGRILLDRVQLSVRPYDRCVSSRAPVTTG